MILIKSNCHTHTLYCDGKNSVREMIDSAIDKGFISLGFSGHSPMYFDNDWAMSKETTQNYIDEIKKLKSEYKGKFDILCGIELDADHSLDNLTEFDYIIGSVHQFIREDKDYPIDLSAEFLEETVKTVFDGDWMAMCKEYYTRLSDFICAVKPDVIGHIDLVTKYNENNCLFDEKNAEYQKVALETVDKILSACENIIFEVNTGAMYRVGKKEPYPAPFIMEHLRKNNAKITITSDSHCTQSLDFGFEEAVDYCKRFGFNKNSIFTSEGIIETDL